MGTWGVRPFDNDDAADFADELSELSGPEHVEAVGRALERTGDLDLERVVAAAALVAEARTPFPADYRWLAASALNRLLMQPNRLADDWLSERRRLAWVRTVTDLRDVLDPPQEETLW